jgi:hypothetical protein
LVVLAGRDPCGVAAVFELLDAEEERGDARDGLRARRRLEVFEDVASPSRAAP